MARLKVLLFALVAVGLSYWAVAASGGATSAAAKQADAQLAQVQQGLTAALTAQNAHQRAVAAELTADPGVVAALVKAAGSEIGPSVDDAPALKAALAEALAKLPEADRTYAAAVLATPAGAVAIVPGHDPLTASAFAWLDAASKAGGDGILAEVAGHAVRVFATPVRAVKSGEVSQLGTIAIAFARDPAGYTKLLEAFPGTTLVEKGKVLATSDKTHSEAAAKLAPGSKALVSGQPASFLIFKLPMPAATLVQARAFAIPDSSLTAVVTANLEPVAQAAAAGQKTGLMALLGILVLGVVVALLAGGEKPDDVADAALLQAVPEAQAAEPTRASPPPPPEPTDAAVTREPMAAAPPPLPSEERTRVAPVPQAPPDTEGVPGFEELFNNTAPAPAPAPAKPAADPLGFLGGSAPVPMPPANMPVANGDSERTGLMSRDMLSQLAAQAAQSAVPLPSASAGPAAIPLPAPRTSAAAPVDERTAVAQVPTELLRAAAQAQSGVLSAEDQHFQEVFREFVQTRERCGEPPESLTFDKFAAKLRKNKEQLVQKYACKSVRFQVYVKEGKAALKATPVKEA